MRHQKGLALGAMTEPHRNLAMRIIEEFAGTMHPAAAEAERARLRQAGPERIHFAWAGALEPRQPHYYRLHGQTLVIEYDNTEDEANHTQPVWHDPRSRTCSTPAREAYEVGPFGVQARSAAGGPATAYGFEGGWAVPSSSLAPVLLHPSPPP